AFQYAAERTLAATTSTVAGPQHPTYRLELGGRDDLVLAEPGARHGHMGTLLFPQPGAYLVKRTAGGAVIAELTTEDVGRRLSLDAGRYRVVRRDSSYLLESDFSVMEGADTWVRPETMQRVDYARVVRKGGTERTRALSAFVSAGARGDLLDLGTAWLAMLGLRLDLPSLSLEARLGYASSQQTNRRLDIDTREVSVALAATRAFDLGRLTVGLGLEAGSSWFAQAFHDPQTPDRDVAGLFVGPIAQLQLPIGKRTYTRLD